VRQAKVLEKKSGTVVLLPPSKRVRRDADFEAGLPGVYPEATGFTIALDGVHTAIYVADVDGLGAAKAFLDRAGLTSNPRFMAILQGLVNAIPRTKIKGEWVVPEAGTLDRHPLELEAIHESARHAVRDRHAGMVVNEDSVDRPGVRTRTDHAVTGAVESDVVGSDLDRPVVILCQRRIRRDRHRPRCARACGWRENRQQENRQTRYQT